MIKKILLTTTIFATLVIPNESHAKYGQYQQQGYSQQQHQQPGYSQQQHQQPGYSQQQHQQTGYSRKKYQQRGQDENKMYFFFGANYNFSGEYSTLYTNNIQETNDKFDLDKKIGLGGGFGIFFPSYNLGVEMEADFRNVEYDYIDNNETKKFDGSTNFYMLNALYHFSNISQTFSPYVGAGVGYSDFTINDGAPFDKGFAYQAIAGVSYKISNEFSFRTSYKYLNSGEMDYKNRDSGAKDHADVKLHSLQFQGVYSF